MRKIHEDIADMALDNQQHGIHAEAVCKAYRQFNDNVSESAIHRSVVEHDVNISDMLRCIVLHSAGGAVIFAICDKTRLCADASIEHTDNAGKAFS